MKHLFSLIILILLLMGLAWGVWWFLQAPSEERSGENGLIDVLKPFKKEELKIINTETFIDSTTLSLRKEFGKTPTLSLPGDGGEIVIKNFYPESVFILEDGHATIVRADDYTITYVAIKKSFQITIKAENIMETASVAEKELLKILEIKPEELCRLHPVLFVDKGYDPKYEYASAFPLSFCPPQ